jgi:hypothetical protein
MEQGQDLEAQPPVRARAVVVVDVLADHVVEVALPDDEYPVEAFSTGALHPTLGIGVRPRRARRGLHRHDALGPEDASPMRPESTRRIADREKRGEADRRPTGAGREAGSLLDGDGLDSGLTVGGRVHPHGPRSTSAGRVSPPVSPGLPRGGTVDAERIILVLLPSPKYCRVTHSIPGRAL